ncbi:MAG TPA: 4-hydroxythreonine-4-phosphate dehydrogenase PdxA [Woeseiaceae bacterium]|nr:4-hydroxythreonine-4-phosphate dehydrogenase PdxA [Woeseiaceae bacterium]
MTSASPPLVVTAGEPAGIGPELVLALADSPWREAVVVIADPANLRDRAARLGRRAELTEVSWHDPAPAAAHGLRILPQALAVPSVCGTPDPANADALLAGLRRAVDGCRRGVFAGLVTGPLQKSTINEAGIPFSGHTEFLAGLLGCPHPVMLLVAGDLRVALATTHLPLRDVPAQVTEERLCTVIRVLHDDLRRRFRIARPAILVCGLNPHAGESGHLGDEERTVLAPAIAAMQAEGVDVRGPVPADTAFTPAAGKADVVLGMYHDQVLPVLKYAGFGKAVNVTLGLSIVRTSVDHGTALDIAGSGTADPGSLLAAVELAAQLSGLAVP